MNAGSKINAGRPGRSSTGKKGETQERFRWNRGSSSATLAATLQNSCARYSSAFEVPSNARLHFPPYGAGAVVRLSIVRHFEAL